jgi:hypothetical protein
MNVPLEDLSSQLKHQQSEQQSIDTISPQSYERTMDIISSLKTRIHELKATIRIERRHYAHYVKHTKEREEYLTNVIVSLTGDSIEKEFDIQNEEIVIAVEQPKSTIATNDSYDILRNENIYLKAQLKAAKRRHQQLLTTSNVQIAEANIENQQLLQKMHHYWKLAKQLPQMIAKIEQGSRDIEERVHHERMVLSRKTLRNIP